MDQASATIVRRFLSRQVLSDDKFRPPKSVVNAVETGKLDSHVLLFWKDVVEKISATSGWKGSGSYAAAIAYWRSKCAKNNFPLPNEYITGLGGKGSQGRWSVKTGDDIEEWVKQTLTSQGLVAEVGKTADEVQMAITHTKRVLDEAQAKVEKHVAGLGKAKTHRGVSQKVKWLGDANAEVGKFEADLEKSIEQVKALKAVAAKKAEVENYSIAFEREFQFKMLEAAKSLDKKGVIEAVHKALERFEKGLEIPGPYSGPADEPNWGEDVEKVHQPGLGREAPWAPMQSRQAGIVDFISGYLLKAYNYLRGAFDLFTDWVEDLKTETKGIESLLKEAGATE
jgi:hypothetical protein